MGVARWGRALQGDRDDPGCNARDRVRTYMARLERCGLVACIVRENDRRNLLARLTEKGQAMINGPTKPKATRLRAAFAGLSAGEMATQTGLLERQGVTEGGGGQRPGWGTAQRGWLGASDRVEILFNNVYVSAQPVKPYQGNSPCRYRLPQLPTVSAVLRSPGCL